MQETLSVGEPFRFVNKSLAQSIQDLNKNRASHEEPVRVQCQAFGGAVKVAHNKDQIESAETIPAGRPFDIDPKGQEMYVVAVDREVRFEYRKTDFGITLYAPMVARSSRQNRTGLTAESINPDAQGETFPSQSVPDGFDVLVQNRHDTDAVFIRAGGIDAIELGPKDSVPLGVSNFDAINVKGTPNNPKVTATVEVDT